jgi:hypothetical protein
MIIPPQAVSHPCWSSNLADYTDEIGGALYPGMTRTGVSFKT